MTSPTEDTHLESLFQQGSAHQWPTYWIDVALAHAARSLRTPYWIDRLATEVTTRMRPPHPVVARTKTLLLTRFEIQSLEWQFQDDRPLPLIPHP